MKDFDIAFAYECFARAHSMSGAKDEGMKYYIQSLFILRRSTKSMNNSKTSLITHISWGHIEVKINGQTLSFKDCKVWPGGAKAWDWNLTGTRHQPGIQPADIEEILAQGIEVMILSRGMQLMLHICPETEQLLRSRNIEYHLEETKQAVSLFNTFMQAGKKVGGIFHSTC